MKSIKIAVDFDGTVVTHEYPNIGKDIGAIPVLKRIVEAGHDLILYTMRSNDELTQAVNWFNENEIKLFGVNTNPEQSTWTNSPKCYANLYIDDAALGAPIKHDAEISLRAFIDWESVEKMLEQYLILEPK